MSLRPHYHELRPAAVMSDTNQPHFLPRSYHDSWSYTSPYSTSSSSGHLSDASYPSSARYNGIAESTGLRSPSLSPTPINTRFIQRYPTKRKRNSSSARDNSSEPTYHASRVLGVRKRRRNGAGVAVKVKPSADAAAAAEDAVGYVADDEKGAYDSEAVPQKMTGTVRKLVRQRGRASRKARGERVASRSGRSVTVDEVTEHLRIASLERSLDCREQSKGVEEDVMMLEGDFITA